MVEAGLIPPECVVQVGHSGNEDQLTLTVVDN